MANIPDKVENKFLAFVKGVLGVIGAFMALAALGYYGSGHTGSAVLSGLVALALFAGAAKIKAEWNLTKAAGRYE